MLGVAGRKGFTLIELLVVIAIIAILAAILFPVFSQARDKARQTTCLSNAKQVGLAVMQYQQDYDEFYPSAQKRNGNISPPKVCIATPMCRWLTTTFPATSLRRCWSEATKANFKAN
jgi:prepilin-type N-terminal cleavage/methylation domain-containing protein